MPQRARRSATQKPKYKDSDNSDEDKDFVDSGSEASIPDSSEGEESSNVSGVENDEEQISFEKKSSKQKKKQKVAPLKPSTSKISMDKIKRSLQSAGLRNEPTQDESIEERICIKDMTEQEKLLPAFLNLSESDSDSDEEDKANQRTSSYSDKPPDYLSFIENESQNVPGPSHVKLTSNKPERLSDTDDSEMEDVCDNDDTNKTSNQSLPTKQATPTKLNFQHLQEHTKRMEEAKESLEQYKKRNSNISSSDKNTLNVQELLAMGEAETVQAASRKKKSAKKVAKDSDSDLEDFEEVNETKPQIPKEGIQLVLDFPSDQIKQKKKKIDLEMMMKRRINRVKKEYQVYIHRVHVLCWLGHGNYLNNVLNDQNIMAATLSLIPSEQCYPGNRVDIKYIEQVTKWYHSVMTLKEDKNEQKYKPNKQSLLLALLQQISKKTVISKKNLVLIFIAMLRALGIKCRLVLSFRVAPLRPPELISLSVKNKEDPKQENDDKNAKGTISSSTKTSQVKSEKETETVKKSKSKKPVKISPNDKISQLDGADDRVSRSTSRKKRSISLNKVPPKQPKLERTSPQSSTSYWDQLMQSVEETPHLPKRVSHRELAMNNPPAYTPPKIKIESSSPIKKSLFDESTLMAEPKSEIFANSTLSLNGSSVSNGPIDKSDKLTRSQKKELDKIISSSTENESNTKRKSLALTKKSAEKVRQSSDKNNAKEAPIKKVVDELNTSRIASRTRSRLNSKDSSVSSTKDSENGDRSTTPNKNISSEKIPKTHSPKPTNKTRRQSANKQTASDTGLQSENRKSLRGKIEKGKSESFVIENPESKPTTSRRSKSETKASSNDSKTNQKQKEKPVSAVKETKESKSKKGNNTSKYFSPENKKDNVKRESTTGRVSHRDLMVKSLAAGVSPQKDVKKDLIAIVKDRVRESKSQAKNKLVKGKDAPNSDSDSDYVQESKEVKLKARRTSEMSDKDFKPSKKKTPVTTKSMKDRRVLSSDDESVVSKKRGVDVWCEVYVEEEEQWISVDVVKAQVHCPNELYSRSSHPVTYVVCWDNSSYMKDVTKRYAPHWNTTTRKLRTDLEWYEHAMRPWKAPASLTDACEDRLLERMQLDAPLPKSIAEFKNHPLYVLKRHLLKFEAIYPPDSPTLGFIRNEPVYARECVHTCRSRETWVKEAKVVKPGEQPYKIVKARPKYDRLSGNLIRDIPLEVFGPWQVQDYVPPAAENGVVPRNAYGNVELFKACMLPKGTVHIPLPGLNKVAKKLNIDCAPAMTGFDYHSGYCHPVYDGFVVCEEFKETIIAAWEQEQEEAEARANEKIEKRVYGNWRRLIRGLLIREKLKAKYDFQDMPETKSGGSSKAKKRSKGPRFVAKKRRSCDPSSSDSN